jgi:hypothetical protein
MRKLTCSPTVELLGMYLSSYINNLQSIETKPIVEKYGLVNLEPQAWYPAHKWLDALNELSDHPNQSPNTLAIGMEIGKLVPVPPDLESPTLEQMLMGLGFAYQAAHRNGDIGNLVCEKVAENHYKVICTDLYPDDLTYGIVYTFARRFLPPKTLFKVYYDEQITPRDKGGNGPTVIHVSWE